MCTEPLVIGVTAPDYRHSSGGVVVLHYLAKLLHDLGHYIVMPTDVINEAWGKYANKCFETPMHFAVFPEVCAGSNGNIARWCLNAPGKLAGPRVYGTNERVWSFSPEIDESAQAASFYPIKRLFLPSIEVSSLPLPTQIKTKEAFFVGKYKGAVQPMGDAIEITSTFPASRKDTYALLNKCSRFWCYDDFSGIAMEAHHFGANVFVSDGLGDWKAFEPKHNFWQSVMDQDKDLLIAEKFIQEAKEAFNL